MTNPTRPLLLVLYFVTAISTISRTSALSRLETTIRAISLDVTGTLVATQEPVIQSYHQAAIWAQLANPPTPDEMKKAFKTAYKERCLESPCFGGVEGISGRDWWRGTVRLVLEHSGRTDYNDEEFDRYFRRVYQHFGSPQGYMVLDDAASLLSALEGSDLLLGITSNTPTRHMESVLPMLNIHDSFSWFTCSQDVGHEKPSHHIFEDAYLQAKFWMPDLRKDQVLHIGDSLACDFCGAKAFGFQALLLDRSGHPAVTAYQDWISAPEYPGKTEEDVLQHTVTSLLEVAELLQLKPGEMARN
jgi:REG-2-like HAD superfamily hydrolase